MIHIIFNKGECMQEKTICSLGGSCGSRVSLLVLIMGIVLLSILFAAASSPNLMQNELAKADTLLVQGEFDDAFALYSSIFQTDPRNSKAILNLGRISLYKNDLLTAEKWLEDAAELDTSATEPKLLLAETFYRQDRFAEAAPLFYAAGQIPKAEKLEYFRDCKPYQIEFPSAVNYVDFIRTDPLPIVSLRLNGNREALFLIDTGGWELSVDIDFADSVDAVKLGSQKATYAGGMQAVTYHGFLDSVQIGEVKIANVPININDGVKRIADAFGMPIKGVIGTVFLYHFIFTLDYPNDRLILEPRSKAASMKKQTNTKAAIVPFWMAGDHIIVAKAKINDIGPYLFFLDTGMAGGGFTGTDWLVDLAGIKLSDEVREGIGGGGAIQIRSGIIDEIELGTAVERDVTGLFGGMPPGFGERFGLQIAGIISHGFLRPYSVTFDFDAMTVSLEK
jgi:hypothetical protein